MYFGTMGQLGQGRQNLVPQKYLGMNGGIHARN